MLLPVWMENWYSQARDVPSDLSISTVFQDLPFSPPPISLLKNALAVLDETWET
jgi:hypothetical protein